MPESARTTGIARSELPTRTVGPLSVRTAKPLIEAGPSRRDSPTERRNLASREALLHRIAMEYDEMPGLRLTAAQAQRLFGLREDICVRVFNALVDAGILRLDINTGDARYGRP